MRFSVSHFIAPLSFLAIAIVPLSARATSITPVPYPDEAVKTFTDTCVAQGDGKKVSNQTMREICTCNIREIQALYTFEEFTKIGVGLGEGKPAPPELNSIVEGCVTEVLKK